MIRRFQRSLRRVEQLADVAVFHLIEVSQLEDHSLDFRQLGNGLLQHSLGLTTIEVFIGQQCICYRQIIRSGRSDMLVSTQKIHALIDGDTRQPCRHLRLAMEIIKAIPCFQKSILKHVVGIVVSEHDATYLPVQLFAILAHYRLELASLIHLSSLLITLSNPYKSGQKSTAPVLGFGKAV